MGLKGGPVVMGSWSSSGGLSSVPSTHTRQLTIAYNSAPGGPDPLLASDPTHTCLTYTHFLFKLADFMLCEYRHNEKGEKTFD